MLTLPGTAKIFLFQEPVDMRKGFEGLSALVETSFEEGVLGGAYFAFLNKSKNRMKVLYWDVDGLAIWYKRLEKGAFSQTKASILERREFFMLLEGIEPKKMRKAPKI